MEIRSSDPLDTMIGGLDTIEIAAPVPYLVSAAFLDSHAGAMDGGEVRGSLAVPPLNMEESGDHDKEGQKRVKRISLSCKLLSLRRLGF